MKKVQALDIADSILIKEIEKRQENEEYKKDNYGIDLHELEQAREIIFMLYKLEG